MASEISARTYTTSRPDKSWPALRCSSFKLAICTAVPSKNTNGSVTISTQNAKIEKLTNSETINAGVTIFSALPGKNLSSFIALSSSTMSAIPDVEVHMTATTIGSVSQNPSGLPAKTAAVVKRVAITKSPPNARRNTGLNVAVTRFQNAFLALGDMRKAESRSKAPQRRIASWRAFKSYQLSMLSPFSRSAHSAVVTPQGDEEYN